MVQAYSYTTTSLHSFIIILFERYVALLEKQFGQRFESVSEVFQSLYQRADGFLQIISQDDCLSMYVETTNERDSVLDTVWLNNDERERLSRCVVIRYILLSTDAR